MSTERKKCPLCNKRLVEVNGIPTCPDCGYRDPQGSRGTTDGQTAGGQGWQSGGQQSAGGWQTTGSGQTGGQQAAAGGRTTGTQKASGEKKPVSTAKAALAATGSVLAAVAVGVVVSLGKRGMSDALDHAANALESRWNDRSEASSAESAGSLEGKPIVGNEGSSGQEETPSVFRLPQSGFLISLTEEIFQKPVSQISAAELNSIIYLDLYNQDDTDVVGTTVMLADGTELSYLFSGDDIDTADFNCLAGLQYLFLETGSVSYNTDWHDLKQLHTLACDASLRDLTQKMDVSQLVWLYTEDTFGMFDLSILSEFTALEYLELEAGTLGDISGISSAPSLRELYILGGDRISDFAELYQMTGLEALSIESSGLKDIGFIEGMDQLYLLELKGTQIRNIDAVRECADTLTVLRLDDNYQVEDISPVLACTGLEELQLWVDYQFDVPMEVPDFSAMTGLRSLEIEGYDRFTNLPLLTGLENLVIECPGSGDGEALRQMAGLKTLWLKDMSVYKELLDCVASLDGLEYLSLEDSFIWCDISPVFNMPSLQGLDLTDAEFGLSPEKVTGSGSLVSLDLDGAEADVLLADGSWNYGDEALIPIQEMLDAIAPCLPNLRWLYVPGQELDSLEFARNLSQLAWLDITNNYVTDLTPLTGLEELTVLLCEDNPIRSKDGLEHVLIYD
ncbi:MAG: hypothetical protein NC432_03335 [Roseburia sp.]|nr:hypothetical protein [Roseburia sp.]MCM1098378.1 hypothetical protein [Ruminococcus flavefaciens]